MAEAVVYLHDKLKIIHRDLKLENFRIHPDSGLHGKIVLADFSTAKVLGKGGVEPVTYHRFFIPIFCAPEQLKHQEYSFNSDTWMLGTAFSVMASPMRISCWDRPDEPKFSHITARPFYGSPYSEIIER